MKATVEISDDLLRRAQAEAASRGLGVGEVIEQALNRGLDQAASNASGRVAFPLHRSSLPGSLTSEAVRSAEQSQSQSEDAGRAASR